MAIVSSARERALLLAPGRGPVLQELGPAPWELGQVPRGLEPAP
jgi:hypothetical protein